MQTHASEWFWERKFIQRHVLLISLEHSPSRKTLTGTDSSVTADLGMVSDCPCAYRVDEKKLQRQVLGPRVPVSRFRNLDDASLDLLPLDRFELLVSGDLVQNPIQETGDPCRCCQIAVAAVIMSDLSAVYAVEAPRSATIGDVYVGDLVV